MIIDTHIHIWNFDRAEYPWLKGDTSILNRHYELDELEVEAAAAGVTKGVLVQAANNEEDSRWILENAAAREWIAGVVGWLPLQDPVRAARLLEEGYGANDLFKGVRHLIHDEADPCWLLQDTVVESLGILASKGIPYDMVGVLPEHIVTALKVAERVPALRMVFDHLNQPPIATGQRFGRWGELMKEAACHKNFFIKISGLGTASGNFQGWQTADLEPYINFAVQHFGGDHCFCGGDWPVALLAGSYVKAWKAYGDILEGWGPEVKEKCLSMNAARFYKL